MMTTRILMITTALLLAGCDDRAGDPTPAEKRMAATTKASMREPAATTATPAAFVGRWLGPEGLFLEIRADGPGRFRIANKDTLDSEGLYVGRFDRGRIRYLRDRTEQWIRPGTGDETGFKWLAGKRDCLIMGLKAEGYCKD